MRVGSLEATLQQGQLRWLRVGGTEILRGIYGAIRDPGWGTVMPKFHRYDLTTSKRTARLEFEALVEASPIRFRWSGTIRLSDDGRCTFRFRGRAESTFARARIGLCVLHPIELAGRRLEAETPWARIEGRFPTRITSITPIGNLVALRQDPGGPREALLRFRGELFEMEDQRNWTDASFKTFGTPLCLPIPVIVGPGDVVDQQITVEIPDRIVRAATNRTAGRRATAIRPGAPLDLPAVGTTLPTTHHRPGPEAAELFRGAGLASLRIAVDPSVGRDAIRATFARAASFGLPIELSVVGGDDELMTCLDDARAAKLTLARLLVFEPSTLTTSRLGLETARRIAIDAGLSATPIGGGARTDLAELLGNSVPGDLDLVAFRICPQIHAFDEASILENLAGIGPAVEAARRVAPGRPVILSPVVLGQDLVPHGDGAPPPPPDPRDGTAFAATWTLGVIVEAARSGVAAVTLSRATGPGGLVGPTGSSPVLHLLRALHRAAGEHACDIAPVNGWTGRIIVRRRLTRYILANLDGEEREASIGSGQRVRIPGRTASVITADRIGSIRSVELLED